MAKFIVNMEHEEVKKVTSSIKVSVTRDEVVEELQAARQVVEVVEAVRHDRREAPVQLLHGAAEPRLLVTKWNT